MLVLTKVWKSVYGDDDSNDGGDPPPTKPSLKALIEEHGLQDEMNAAMSSNRKNLTQKNSELVGQLEKLKGQASTTTHEKEELQAQIEDLQTQYLSKEELARRGEDKLKKDHAKVLETVTSEASKWQGLYVASTTQRALLDAAVHGEAVQPQQIVSMLGQSTQIVEDVDSAGNSTGNYKPIVKFNDTNDSGEPIVLDLSPSDAIKRMKDLPEMYGNLFKGEATGGLGGNTSAGSGISSQPKLKELMENPAKYAKWRKENPELDLSKLR